jgi:hypothetical protein
MKIQTIIDAMAKLAKEANNPSESRDFRRGVRSAIESLATATALQSYRLSQALYEIAETMWAD